MFDEFAVIFIVVAPVVIYAASTLIVESHLEQAGKTQSKRRSPLKWVKGAEPSIDTD
jgi:hypothetical protein